MVPCAVFDLRHLWSTAILKLLCITFQEILILLNTWAINLCFPLSKFKVFVGLYHVDSMVYFIIIKERPFFSNFCDVQGTEPRVEEHHFLLHRMYHIMNRIPTSKNIKNYPPQKYNLPMCINVLWRFEKKIRWKTISSSLKIIMS